MIGREQGSVSPPKDREGRWSRGGQSEKMCCQLTRHTLLEFQTLRERREDLQGPTETVSSMCGGLACRLTSRVAEGPKLWCILS